MSEQYGNYAPPPQVPGQPPQQQPPVSQPPMRKSKTGLIIAIIIGVFLLLCGCLTVGGFLLFSSTDSTSSPADFVDSVAVDPGDTDRLIEWLAWGPDTIEQLPQAPTEDAELIADALGVLAPGLTAAETGYSEGFVDLTEDYYYGDLYLVRGYHASSDQVSAGIEFTLQSPAMIAEDIPFETESGDSIDTIADGTIDMISRGPFGSIDFPLGSLEGDALWRTIGEDWPDAVVMRITTETANRVSVSITKWRQYAIEDYSPRLLTVYELSDGEWSLSDWEYDVFDDTPVEPIEDAPVT